MIYMGPWLMGVIASQAKEDFQLDYIRFPSLPDGRPDARTAIMGGMSSVGVSARTEHPQAVAKFLNLFASDLDRAREFVDETGFLSPLMGIEAPEPPTLPFRLVQEFESAADVYNWWDQFLPPMLSQQLLDLSQPLLGGEITPEEFAQTMEDATLKYLARQ
jgi:raffinose/stachyose/melibiose transport system substrate-binding protein